MPVPVGSGRTGGGGGETGPRSIKMVDGFMGVAVESAAQEKYLSIMGS